MRVLGRQPSLQVLFVVGYSRMRTATPVSRQGFDRRCLGFVLRERRAPASRCAACAACFCIPPKRPSRSVGLFRRSGDGGGHTVFKWREHGVWPRQAAAFRPVRIDGAHLIIGNCHAARRADDLPTSARDGSACEPLRDAVFALFCGRPAVVALCGGGSPKPFGWMLDAHWCLRLRVCGACLADAPLASVPCDVSLACALAISATALLLYGLL